MTDLTDVIILIPGISGSALAKDGREIWGTSPGALWRAATTLGHTIQEMALAQDDPEVEDLGDGVVATRIIPDLHLIPGLWKIDGYTATAKALKDAFDLRDGENYFAFPYDWRRDNRVSARRLEKCARRWLENWRSSSGNADAKLVLIAHSMGGLVARYFLEALQGWRETRSLITFGTPYRGSLNAVGYLANGYAKDIGPLTIDLSSTLRSFTAVYQLLPAYACMDLGNGQLHRVGEIAGLPNIDAARAAAALAFHREIKNAQEENARDEAYHTNGYAVFPIVGIRQPTFQSAAFADGKVALLRTYNDRDESGDGTVPRVSATPLELSKANREQFFAESHGSLQNFDPILVAVRGIVTGLGLELEGRDYVETRKTVGLAVHDVYAAGDIAIKALPSEPADLIAVVTNVDSGTIVAEMPMRHSAADGAAYANVRIGPGAYRVTIRGDETVHPVTDTFLVVESNGGK